VHHTQLIHDLIRNGRLDLKGRLDDLTYHDPCYLGRHNDVYKAPREVLHALSRSRGFRELERNRSRALCCGAGGGHAWMDDRPSRPIHHSRYEEIEASGARTAASSCPFCLQRLEGAREVLDPGGRVRIVDIAELVAEALEP
jgi:Fe-S oxidoreductase